MCSIMEKEWAFEETREVGEEGQTVREKEKEGKREKNQTEFIIMSVHVAFT